MAEQELKRPVPSSNALTEPFWEATRQHKLVVQYCEGCDKLVWYPREICPDCWTMEGIEWR